MLTITVLQFHGASSEELKLRRAMLTAPSPRQLMESLDRGEYRPVAEVSVDTDKVDEALRTTFVATNTDAGELLVRKLSDYRKTMSGDLMVVQETGEVHMLLALGTVQVASHIAQLAAVSSFDSGSALMQVTMDKPICFILGIKALRSTFELGLREAKETLESGASFMVSRKDLSNFVIAAIRQIPSSLADAGAMEIKHGYLRHILTNMKAGPALVLSARASQAA